MPGEFQPDETGRMRKQTVKAAQPSGPTGPVPEAPQQHVWHTVQEYDAQMAMPVHLVRAAHFEADAEGNPRYVTLCHKLLGTELLRTTDIRSDVTCVKCRRKRR